MSQAISADGTTIGYDRLSDEGPVLVLVGGGLDDGTENVPLGTGRSFPRGLSYMIWTLRMASTILSTALLLPAGWTPDAELKTRGPRRDDLLFGHWPLP